MPPILRSTTWVKDHHHQWTIINPHHLRMEKAHRHIMHTVAVLPTLLLIRNTPTLLRIIITTIILMGRLHLTTAVVTHP